MLEDEISLKLKHTPLMSPFLLLTKFSVSPALQKRIASFREIARKIIHGQDQRLLVITGPCSIHDTQGAYEFAKRLSSACEQFNQELFIIMRVYFEKPRTTLGWKGLINDPHLNGSADINHGLTLARQFLLDLAELGVPAATEFLDPIVPQYLSDLISWNAVGARTTESQLHRAIASNLPTPVGFKNTTDGNIQIAVDAALTTRHAHHYLSIDNRGSPVIVNTTGNSSCHIILRGAQDQPNYSIHSIHQATQMLTQAGLMPHVMIDCSHGNSRKNQQNQIKVARYIAEQIRTGSKQIFGVMLESNLIAGNQKLEKDKNLNYGQSITDECISWEDTWRLLEELAEAKRSLLFS